MAVRSWITYRTLVRPHKRGHVEVKQSPPDRSRWHPGCRVALPRAAPPWHLMGMALKVGDAAPPFDVTASDGRRLALEDFRGTKNVVLYFYPKDFTMVCTTEACGFRDLYDELVAADTEVIGVSVDSDESHRGFADRHRLTFPLVADPGRTLARAYGATGGLRDLLGVTSRVTYVIDKQGTIAGVFDSQLRASKHLDGVKRTIQALRG
jgi:thioredoxin-dependent peroxiredoxin